MLDDRKVIFFELNEVPYRVYRHYADRRPDSAIAELLRVATRIETVATDVGHLSPWITWPTVHRGVNNERHQIRSLGQDTVDADAEFPPVWSLIADAGRSVGVFGSLHSYPLPDDVGKYAFFVPDTFAAGPETHPAALSTFQGFNLRMVDASGRNVSRAVPLADSLDLLRRAPGLGLRVKTVAKIARQLVGERLNPARVGRRRTIQSLLAFDFFRRALEDTRPDCSFFFTNHVASSQHRYWPATFPDDYREPQQSAEWRTRFGGEIDYAMSEADAMLGDLIAFAKANPDYVLISTGSMGQTAVDGAGTRVQRELQLRDPAALMTLFGIAAGKWSRRRTMEPLYTFVLDADVVDRFRDHIANLTVNEAPVEYELLNNGAVSVLFGNHDLDDDRMRIRLHDRDVPVATTGLVNVKIDDESGSAAYHVAEGCLLIYDPRETATSGPVEQMPTTAIAPMLLANFGIAQPAYMSAAGDTAVVPADGLQVSAA